MNRALLVGINAYPNCPLRGCLDDVESIANRLVKYDGFAREDIRIVADDRATTEGIQERLEWLASDLQPGDRVLFQYSGHGALFPIRDESGKISSNHCCICPYDFDWTRNHTLIDDDFMLLFKDIPEGVIFNWISDSCHSGSLARELMYIVDSDGYSPIRAFPVPDDILWRIGTAQEMGLEPMALERSIQHLEGAFMSGCKSNQTSADAYIGGRYCGAFTDALTKVLGRHSNIPLDGLVMEVNEVLSAGGFTQRSEVHGLHVERPWLGSFKG